MDQMPFQLLPPLWAADFMILDVRAKLEGVDSLSARIIGQKKRPGTLPFRAFSSVLNPVNQAAVLATSSTVLLTRSVIGAAASLAVFIQTPEIAALSFIARSVVF